MAAAEMGGEGLEKGVLALPKYQWIHTQGVEEEHTKSFSGTAHCALSLFNFAMIKLITSPLNRQPCTHTHEQVKPHMHDPIFTLH
jgi:hypothetical protein